MERTYLIITAQTTYTPSIEEKSWEESSECHLILGVIKKICSHFNVDVLRAECFQKDHRLASLLRADATNIKGSVSLLRQTLEEAGKRVGAIVRVQKEDLFRYMHRI